MLGFYLNKVTGMSMHPRIPSGSFIISTRWLRFLLLRSGQMFYLQHPRYGCIVKTLHYIDKEKGYFWFKGESDQSLSIDELGAISKDSIIGRVICVAKPRL